MMKILTTITTLIKASKNLPKLLKNCGYSWKWQEVTNENYKWVIDLIIASSSAENIVVINLCDGDEINNTPGVNIIRHLKKAGCALQEPTNIFIALPLPKY